MITIKAPIIAGNKPGILGKIEVKIGDKVTENQVLTQIETGKGSKPVKATANGVIKEILHLQGDEIKTNDEIFKVEDYFQKTTEAVQVSVQKTNASADTLILGGGPGGYVAAIYAAKNGQNVILVEQEKLGGTCLNVGCIPTKALVKSSEICHNAKNSKEFGIFCENVKVDMPKVIQRKNNICDTLVQGVEFLMDKNKITVLHGTASFVSEKTVDVTGADNCQVNAKNIIIATGSKISKINIPGIELPFVLNSTTALSSTELPSSITIIGGGVIGMEFAFIYNNLGVDVTVIEFMDRLLTMVDEDASKEIYRIATEKGVKILLSSKVLKIQSSDQNSAIVTYQKDGIEHITVSQNVLVAIGREPNTDNLNLEKSGVALNESKKGIKVDTHMATNVSGTYAIGDVTNIIQLAHVASHQGMVAVDNILGKNKEMDYSAIPNVIFTSPEIASVGQLPCDLEKKNIPFTISRFDFRGNGKALTLNEPNGFIKLIRNDNTNKIVGATIIGADASALISTVTLAIQNGLSEKEITHTVFAHPTTGEVIHEAALGLGIGSLHS